MVKQYDDGYFVNGEWFDGQFNKVSVDVIDGPHLKPIYKFVSVDEPVMTGKLIAWHDPSPCKCLCHDTNDLNYMSTMLSVLMVIIGLIIGFFLGIMWV